EEVAGGGEGQGGGGVGERPDKVRGQLAHATKGRIERSVEERASFQLFAGRSEAPVHAANRPPAAQRPPQQGHDALLFGGRGQSNISRNEDIFQEKAFPQLHKAPDWDFGRRKKARPAVPTATTKSVSHFPQSWVPSPPVVVSSRMWGNG